MTVRIEGEEFMLFKDRDYAKLPRLSFRGKIRWFELRLRRMLIDPAEMLKPRRRGQTEEDLSHLLAFGTVICNGIEALGSFYRGRDGTGQTFRDFVTDFMDSAYGRYSRNLRDDFRNGLAHGFYVKQGGFEFFRGPSLRIDPRAGVQIDPDGLFRDVKRALKNYLRKLRRDGPSSPIGQAFSKRFRRIYET